ncbi:cytochrome C-552 [Roseovarius sp. SCSIO 43702]|uniref:cytochrome C-552 n=1 Tax=Roseovarius sp. SCSIO 43702 TaxID=2823043 RepID=UPI001C73586D|nr:cytochrome C-552 [Roseovarius sp. SCSIO 43702]QYX57156.1 cytochrome C-552 [Roseovarius sp. SCSIO 43702]
MKKTPTVLRATLCATALLIATAGHAQDAYDPMRPAANPLAPAAGATPEPETPEAEPDPELGNLPAGPGAEETYYQCVACHSTAIIRQQRLSDERWDYLWTWMIEDQGMVEPDEETKELILTYLKTHFSSER